MLIFSNNKTRLRKLHTNDYVSLFIIYHRLTKRCKESSLVANP